MNNNKSLKLVLCTALIMAFAMGLCIAPASALPYAVTVGADKATYTAGSLVTISGTATNSGVAAAGILVSVIVTDPAGGIPYTNIATTGTNGSYSTQFRIAGLSLTGTWSISATASVAGSQVATALPVTFAVTSPTSLTINPVWAAPAATVSFTGTNFTANSRVSVGLTWSGLAVSLATVNSTAAGAISGTFIVPSIASQVYTVTATDSAGLASSAVFGIGQIDAGVITSAVTTALNNVQGNITTALNSVNTAVAALPATVQSGITSGLSTVTSSLSTLTSTVNSIQSAVTTLQGTVTQINTNDKVISDTLALVYTNLNTVSNTLQTVPAALNGISGNVTGVSSSVTSLNNVVSSLSASVTTLQGNINTLQTDVSTIKSQTSNISTDVANQISGINTLVIVAIVLALIAAIAAIASIVMMRRKIAG